MKIILSGSLAIDQIMTFDGLYENMIQPEKLHVLSISMLVQQFKRSKGGTAGNIAYSLALLGESPILFASIGKDDTAYIDELQSLGVDTSTVHFSDLPTATFSVLTDKNDCQVGGFYPGAMSDSATLSVKKWKDDDIIMVVSAHDPKQMVTQIKECKKFGKKLFFDIGQQIVIFDKKQLLLGIETAEILCVNDYEMGLLSKKTGFSEQEIITKVPITIVTLGSKGAFLYTKENQWKKQIIGAVEIEKPVDPTGAGDAFRAGFLYGYVRNWSPQKSVQLGCVVASYAVEKHGTQEHHFTRKSIAQRYQSTYQEMLW